MEKTAKGTCFREYSRAQFQTCYLYKSYYLWGGQVSSLGSRAEFQVEHRNLRSISLKMAFEAIRLDEIHSRYGTYS